MSSVEPIREDELHAFVDGALQAARREEVAAILRADPARAAWVDGYARDRELLREAVAQLSARPLPPNWAAQIEAATARRAPARLGRRYAIAASLAVAIGAAAAVKWWPHGDTILADALAVRDGTAAGRALPQGVLADAAQRDAQLASAVGLPAHAPDLQHFGFQLTAMQLFTRGAQLRYADRSRRILTIYVRPSDGTVRFDMLRQGTQRICIWQDNVVGAVIVAPLSAGEMMRVASKAYGDLDL